MQLYQHLMNEIENRFLFQMVEGAAWTNWDGGKPPEYYDENFCVTMNGFIDNKGAWRYVLFIIMLFV